MKKLTLFLFFAFCLPLLSHAQSGGITNTFGPSIVTMTTTNNKFYLNKVRVVMAPEVTEIYNGLMSSTDRTNWDGKWTPGTTNNGAALTDLSRLQITDLASAPTNSFVAIPSNAIVTSTNTSFGRGPGLLSWGVDGGTNYLYQSIATNRWGRVALSTNF